MNYYLFEFLPKVVVKPGVEERVVTRGRHGDRVHQEERKVVKLPRARRYVDVVHQVDQVERKPRHTEYRHHGYQHAIGAAFPLSVRFFFSSVFGTGLGARSVVQLQRHADVAEGDYDEREHELHGRRQPTVYLQHKVTRTLVL